MSGDQSFQQRWGLRGKEVVDSSSEESESHSLDDQVLKKHRLIPSSDLPENEEIGNSQGTKVPHKATSSKFGKSGKKRNTNVETKQQIQKQTETNTKRKRKEIRNTHVDFKPVSFSDLTAFSESLIDELKVAREEMFARSNEEMSINAVKSIPRPKRKLDNIVEEVGGEKQKETVEILGEKALKTTTASLKRPAKNGKAKGLKSSPVVIEDEVIIEKTPVPVSKFEKSKINPSNFPPKEATYSLPQNLNKSGISLTQHDEMPSQGYFSGTQMPEQFRNISQMGLHNMSYFSQMRNTSSMGFPLHQGLRNGFGFPNQALENLPRGNDILGPRMDGGIMRLTGGNNGFYGHYVGNNSNGKSE